MQPAGNDPFPRDRDHPCGGCKDLSACKQWCPEHYVCNNKLLQEIAVRLPGDWEKLGIYLGVSKQERDKIRGETRNKVEAWGLDMFNKWWQNAKPESRWSDLQNALTEVHRHDLIQFTKDFFAEHNVTPDNPDPGKMEKYFQKMAEQIPRDWKDIGIYLYLSLDDLHKIQMAGSSVSTNTKTFQILQAWRKMPNSKCRDLETALEDMGRRDIIMYIEQEVDGYKRVCSLSNAHQQQQQERLQQEELARQRLLQEQERQRLEREKQHIEQQRRQQQQELEQIERQRQLLEQQRREQPDFMPSHPPTGPYIPRDARGFPMQQPHNRWEPPPTAFQQGAAIDSVQENESVSRTSIITQPTDEPSPVNPDYEPSQQLQSTQVNSLQQAGGTNPSFVSSPPTEPGVSLATQGIRNMHLDNTDGTGSNISANTFTTDLTTDISTEMADDNLSLVLEGDTEPSQPSAPRSSVVVGVDQVELQFPQSVDAVGGQ